MGLNPRWFRAYAGVKEHSGGYTRHRRCFLVVTYPTGATFKTVPGGNGSDLS